MMRIGRFFQLVALILLAAGAQPAVTAVFQWSTTAGTNATADPNINWAEGQAPSSINDSARAMMAALATWRNDISGAILATGSASAYAVTTGQTFASVTDLRFSQITFIAPATNADGVTLTVNGIGAYPIQIASGVAVPAGTLIAGAVYTVTGYGTVAPGSFTLRGYYSNTFNIPLGGLLYSTFSTPPNANFVAAGGQCISTTTYAAYWGGLGSPASGSCAGGQFAILDMRSRVAVGLDTLGPLGAAGRLTSSVTGCGTAMTSMGASCSNGVQSQTLLALNLPPITSSGSNSISVVSNLLLIDATGVLQDFNPVTAAGFRAPSNTASLRQQTSTGTNSITVNSTGTTSTPIPTTDPNAAVYIYVRVL